MSFAKTIRTSTRPAVTILTTVTVCLLEAIRVVGYGQPVSAEFWAFAGVANLFWFGGKAAERLGLTAKPTDE